jgi:hypothetical protein
MGDPGHLATQLIGELIEPRVRFGKGHKGPELDRCLDATEQSYLLG